MPGGVQNLQRASRVNVDHISIFHNVIGGIYDWHPGRSLANIHEGSLGRVRHSVPVSKFVRPLNETFCVVVPIDELCGPSMHRRPYTPFAGDPRCHADMIRMKVRDDQGANRRRFEPKARHPTSECNIALSPIHSAIDQRETLTILDDVRVDRRRGPKGEWQGYDRDPLAQVTGRGIVSQVSLSCGG